MVMLGSRKLLEVVWISLQNEPQAGLVDDEGNEYIVYLEEILNREREEKEDEGSSS